MADHSIAKILFDRAKAGDRSAVEELFEMHVDPLLIFTRSRMGGELRGKLEPEDILQEAFAAAVRGLDDFEYVDDGAFRRWMCRIIEHRVRDAHDHFHAKKRQTLPRAQSAPTGPWTALGRAENRQRIQAALDGLTVEHREVLLLRYFEGVDAAEAGIRMHRSANAIRSLTARALVELGKHLKSLEDSGS